MANRNPIEAFIWGAGGEALSPGQVAERRRIASELAAKEVPGLGHWAATLNQGLTGFLSGRERRMADEGETAGRQGFQSQWDSIFSGGGSPVAAALAGGGEMVPAMGGASAPQTALGAANALASVPSGQGADYIRSGLINRGLPEHVADAFLLNMQDESGLNPGINEAAPLVPGSRGGYGLYQLTGPRRRAYEAYASQQGIPLDSVDGQLDFLMSELQGPEAAAAKSILSAPDTGSAAAAIVNQFLRPSEQHRARREAAYLGGAARPPSDQVAQVVGGQPSVAQLLSLAGNEWANPGQSNVINALLDQQIKQQDPAYQLSRQKTELEIQKLLNPEAPAPVFEGGRWWDRSGGVPTPLTDPTVSPTSGMQNYDFLISQGVSPQDAAARAFSGGVTVNTGNQGPQVGTIPPSMALVADPTNPTGYRMETIPGSPEAIAAEQAAAAAEIGTENTGRTANIVREDLGRIRDIVNNAPWFNPAVGFGADVAQAVAGSNATNVAALSKTVLANIGFDRLQQMRDASPTGGALGAISDRELGTLQSVMGNLEQSQSVDQFMYNLDRLGTIYDEILTKASAYPNASAFGIQAPSGTEEQQTYPNAPAVGALVEGYRFKGGDPAVMENWEMVQ